VFALGGCAPLYVAKNPVVSVSLNVPFFIDL